MSLGSDAQREVTRIALNGVDAIRRAGVFTNDELVAAAAQRDAGFEIGMFATQLDAVRRIMHRDVVSYGVSADDLETAKERTIRWAGAVARRVIIGLGGRAVR